MLKLGSEICSGDIIVFFDRTRPFLTCFNSRTTSIGGLKRFMIVNVLELQYHLYFAKDSLFEVL